MVTAAGLQKHKKLLTDNKTCFFLRRQAILRQKEIEKGTVAVK